MMLAATVTIHGRYSIPVVIIRTKVEETKIENQNETVKKVVVVVVVVFAMDHLRATSLCFRFVDTVGNNYNNYDDVKDCPTKNRINGIVYDKVLLFVIDCEELKHKKVNNTGSTENRNFPAYSMNEKNNSKLPVESRD